MITLNDYLYKGDTVIKILHNYSQDLAIEAAKTENEIDLIHSNFLAQLSELLEHGDFLTSQSMRMREFYQYMTMEYPDLAFTFKGRIKSLIRAEAKFNGQIASFIYGYHERNGSYPSAEQIISRLSVQRDLVAYRIILSIPRCHAKDEEDRLQKEQFCLYDIANKLPGFLKERGFEAQLAQIVLAKDLEDDAPGTCPMLSKNVRHYYKDYVVNRRESGYQSLHITLFDHVSHGYIEVQLRTFEMDCYAEIGPANHMGYEARQEEERRRRDAIPVGECSYFDDAYERVVKLQDLQLNEVRVNMFSAASNTLINDNCGLFRGRLILPYEHLSRYQNG